VASRHSVNAAAALENHRVWFGDAAGVEYRAGPRCDWAIIPYAVPHGETIGWERRGTNPQTTHKIIKRVVFVDLENLPAGLKLNAQIRIGGECGPAYTVVDMVTKLERVALHLKRSDVAEITRPGYRGPIGGA
jgi:hypothetical protein